MSQFATAPQGTEACDATFHATIGRLLFLCGAAPAAAEIEEVVEAPPVGEAPHVGLAEWDDGAYIGVAAFLGAASLGHLDAACRRLRELDRAPGGPWYQLGLSVYSGLELHGVGIFDPFGTGTPALGTGAATGRRLARLDWKRRYGRFLVEVPTFQAPFSGTVITEVQQSLAAAPCRCPVLVWSYFEVEVLANPGRISLCVGPPERDNDFVFEPHQGTVHRSSWTLTYLQGLPPLTITTPGRGFEGSIGVLVREGYLAFFRRRAARAAEGEELDVGPWESTGFVAKVPGDRPLTPSLRFHERGLYHVRTTRLNSPPPVTPKPPKPLSGLVWPWVSRSSLTEA